MKYYLSLQFDDEYGAGLDLYSKEYSTMVFSYNKAHYLEFKDLYKYDKFSSFQLGVSADVLKMFLEKL